MDTRFQHVSVQREGDNDYRCLHTLLQLKNNGWCAVISYQNTFTRMYSTQTFAAASTAIARRNPFYGLIPLDEDLQELPAHQALLAAYEKLQQDKHRIWSAQRWRPWKALATGVDLRPHRHQFAFAELT